jgi:GNAT superfamily N-acetyltransferase
MTHAAWLDGEIVCAGTCAPTAHGLVLFGGATRASARGRGAYRALIHARYQEALARRTPALLTQAGSMSRPILERMGFRAVGRIDMLLDEFGDA